MKRFGKKLWVLAGTLLLLFAISTGSLSGGTLSALREAAEQTEQALSDNSSIALFRKRKKKKNTQNNQASGTQSTSAAQASGGAKTESGAGSGTADGTLTVEKDGSYTSKEEVALYIHEYGELPSNFITKREAEKLGWDSRSGNLDEVAPGKSIGGGRFGNYEGNLPEKNGRTYYECDIDYKGGHRNAKRIVYSSDGLIFYTEDHYKTFEQLY